MIMQGPDFSYLWGNDKFADVELLLREEQEQGQDGNGSAPPEELLLRCHAVVLMTFSPYIKTKLENWDTAPDAVRRKSARHSTAQDSAARQHRIELPVPRGQLDVGQLLVRSMYAAAPDLSGASQQQLTQLLLLADRYEVAKVTAAVSAAVEAIPVAEFAWDTLTAVYRLPPGAAELPACSGLFAAAAAKLQHELGDLELVWADISKQTQLLDLPFAGLKQLLEDAATRVASECTVLYTLERWCKRQRQPLDEQLFKEQLRQLVGLVRMRHCGKSYVTTVFAGGQVADRALTRQELAAACAVAGTGKGSSGRWPLDAAQWGWPALKQFPGWTQRSRPATARGAALECWTIPATELRAAFDDALSGEGGLVSDCMAFGGVECELLLQISCQPAAASTEGGASSSEGLLHNMKVALYVHVPNLSESAVVHLDREVLVKTRTRGKFVSLFRDTEPPLTEDCGGWGTYFKLGAVSSYARFVAALRQQDLVMEDGSMQVQLKLHAVH